MVCIEAFILALSPAAAVLASAIFLYESVITDSNWGACSSVILSVSFHLGSAFLAISSGVCAACFADAGVALSALLPWARTGEARSSRTNVTQPNRTNLIWHLRYTAHRSLAVGRWGG